MLFEHDAVSIPVDRFFGANEHGMNVEMTTLVGSTQASLEIGVNDISRREEKWYDCFYQAPRPSPV